MSLYKENTGRNEESVRRSQEYLDSKAEERERLSNKWLNIAILIAAITLTILTILGR